MEAIINKNEEKIMKLVSKLDGKSKLALISKIEDTLDKNALEQIYTKQFIEDMEQAEKDLESGNVIQVDSLEEIFGK